MALSMVVMCEAQRRFDLAVAGGQTFADSCSQVLTFSGSVVAFAYTQGALYSDDMSISFSAISHAPTFSTTVPIGPDTQPTIEVKWSLTGK